jgi:hypothetical protein
MTDGVSNEPVIASTPVPISVEPRTAPPAEAAEVARQAEEAKLPRDAAKKEPEAADAAKEDKAKPRPSIREALAAAREKLDADPATPAKAISVAAKEPAAAKEAPAAKAAEPVAKPDAQPRADDGKFTAKVAEPASKADAQATVADASVAKEAPAAKAADAVDKPATLPSHTASAPPARFSPAAKEKWAEAPEEVRAETERAVKELTAGFEKHRAAAERDSSLNEYHDLAAKGGTDVKTALSKYVGMENLLRQDVVKGFAEICKNAGLNLHDVAAKILNQAPDEARSQSDATIRDLTARLERAEAAVGTIHQERQQAVTETTTASVAKFAAENPRFEELSDDIAFFLKTRTKDLAEAYKLAERLNPASVIPAPAPAPAAVASSAPAAALKLVPPALSSSSDAGSKSIAGTPTAGSDPVRKQPSNSIREAIRKATAAAR